MTYMPTMYPYTFTFGIASGTVKVLKDIDLDDLRYHTKEILEQRFMDYEGSGIND